MLPARLLVLFAAALWTTELFAQSRAVTGIVVDARTGTPLAGVQVSVEGEAAAADTDADGHFALALRSGRFLVRFSLVGYAVRWEPLVLDAGASPVLHIELAEGAGAFTEEVSVAAGARHDADAAPSGITLHGRELQALRGVTLDDPLRGLQALPSAVATDDFYSEFAVRGLGFRHTGLTVDGVPTRYLMHSVHGVPDGGSIAMLNSDAVASTSLMPGSYPQRFGRRIGSQVDVVTRDGDREGRRLRAGLSGTSAAVLAEGPLAGGRGAWLVSGRRSYFDLLMKRIDEENSLAFGFADAQMKLTFDATPRHQLQALAIAGRSRFDEKPENLAANDEALVVGRSWLTALTWRYTPSPVMSVTQRVYTTGLAFDNTNVGGAVLDVNRSRDAAWRADVSVNARPGWLLELGGDLQQLTVRRVVNRSLNDAPTLTPLADYRASGRAASAYAQAVVTAMPGLTVSPGVRVDYWGASATATGSPWATAEARLTPKTRLRGGAGLYQQFPDLEQLQGVRGNSALRPERAWHADLGIVRDLPRESRLQVTWYGREERDVLWTPGSEPRRLADGSVALGRGDAPWTNALSGHARGLEVLVRRDAPTGLSGWAGYAYSRHRYTRPATGESFWSDADQRHALSLFGYYRLTNRTTMGVKFRYGSNYPRVGYIGESTPDPAAPPLFGGGIPLFHQLDAERNELRLPAYARLDLRADRTFDWARRRVTLFVELANALNRRNLRNTPYAVDLNGRVLGGTDSLLPLLPSAGLVVEF